MGKPYSLDLRKRVVAAVLHGGMSRNEAAKQFGVGISTAINWVKRQQETGSVAPGQMGAQPDHSGCQSHHGQRFRHCDLCSLGRWPLPETDAVEHLLSERNATATWRRLPGPRGPLPARPASRRRAT